MHDVLSIMASRRRLQTLWIKHQLLKEKMRERQMIYMSILWEGQRLTSQKM